jgi:hypothetical protein
MIPISKQIMYKTKWRRLFAPTQLSIQGQWLHFKLGLSLVGKIAQMGELTGHALQRSANSVCSACFSAACEPYNIHKSSPRQTSTAQTARISQHVAGFDYLSSEHSRGLQSWSRRRNMLSGNRTPRTIYSGLVTWNRLLRENG